MNTPYPIFVLQKSPKHTIPFFFISRTLAKRLGKHKLPAFTDLHCYAISEADAKRLCRIFNEDAKLRPLGSQGGQGVARFDGRNNQARKFGYHHRGERDLAED